MRWYIPACTHIQFTYHVGISSDTVLKAIRRTEYTQKEQKMPYSVQTCARAWTYSRWWNNNNSKSICSWKNRFFASRSAMYVYCIAFTILLGRITRICRRSFIIIIVVSSSVCEQRCCARMRFVEARDNRAFAPRGVRLVTFFQQIRLIKYK